MEEAALQTMRTNCSFAGARRYFVTGIVQQRTRIPNSEHDVEGDVTNRDYNRVTVPSYLWTAACCDASNSANQEDGFSFAYIGKNVADSFVDILSVSELETKLTSSGLAQDRYQTAKIFVDECKENSAKSKTARAQVAVPMNIRLANAANGLSRAEQSSIPLKKRKILKGVVGLIGNKQVSAQGYSLARIELGVDLARDINVLNKARDAMFSLGASLLLFRAKPPLPLLNDKLQTDASYRNPLNKRHTTSKRHNRHKSKKRGRKHLHGMYDEKRKRTSDQATTPEVDEYLIVPDLSLDGSNVTVQGDRCIDSSCGFHGTKNRWCYTDWAKKSKASCCFTKCTFQTGKDHQTCQTNNTKSTATSCSNRYSTINVKGQRCLAEHQCGLHGYSYYWCYIDVALNWDYCCQPWHPCGEHKYSYRWCYTGKSKSSSTYQYCKY